MLLGGRPGDLAAAEALLLRCGFVLRKRSRDEVFDLFGMWTAESFAALADLIGGRDLSLTEALQQAIASGLLPCGGTPVRSRVRLCEDGTVRIYLDRRDHNEE